MNFLFLFGLIFLSGCIHRTEKKDKDIKASKVEINQDEGGAFVTPSKDLKALRLKSFDTIDQENKQSPSIPKISKESIQARLTDIPVFVGSLLLEASVDAHNNKYLTYTSTHTYLNIVEYYQSELRHFGWQIKTLYTDENYMMITAKKPHKTAVFILEFHKKTWWQAPYTTITIVLSFS